MLNIDKELGNHASNKSSIVPQYWFQNFKEIKLLAQIEWRRCRSNNILVFGLQFDQFCALMGFDDFGRTCVSNMCILFL